MFLYIIFDYFIYHLFEPIYLYQNSLYKDGCSAYSQGLLSKGMNEDKSSLPIEVSDYGNSILKNTKTFLWVITTYVPLYYSTVACKLSMSYKEAKLFHFQYIPVPCKHSRVMKELIK